MKENLILQTFDWKESNDIITEYDGGNEIEIQKYVIKAYGRTEDNKSVYLKINNYKPYFYIKKPDYWNNDNIKSYINYIFSLFPIEETAMNNSKYVNSKNIYNEKILNEFYKYEIEEHCDLVGFTNYTKFEFIKLSFLSMRAFYAFKKVIKEGKINSKRILKKNYKIQIYESKIKPFLDFIHEKDLKTCGWLKVLKYKKIKGNELTYCDINIQCDYNNIVNHEETKMTKQIVASFDIECYSESGMFPNANNPNDYITQIGTVFCYYGETEPFYSNIITLEGCEKIKGMENVVIKSYDTERKVLKSWTKLIQKMDPDYIVGFNINGFDFKYMYDRAEKLNILNDFSLLDRNKRQKTKYMDGSDKKNKMGSSKAFGENELYYFDFDGRVLIDVFTNIKRNIALECYKLDFIASTYIKEKIIDYSNYNDTCKIKTNSIYGISEDQYITVSYFDGLTTNTHNQKYQITKIEDISEKEKVITVNGIIPEDIRQFKKLCWCHAKDDVSAKDMFRLQKGNDYDRGIIAKYCIMDCILVIKIMDKLQILNNNIGMANVCFVPLSYIFMRGQSIKGQSLLSKVCKTENHLIPDIEPPENYGNEEDKDKYEGAIVFTPKFIKLYKTPVIVLDYSSLYPSTAICYNISHETLILDKKYMDLEEYKYNKINFDVNGKEQVWYYAERKDGTKGIIPRILDGLLKKRKSVKKEMESCNDPFLAKILDGLQLAYKMTANSIYGLLGAKVSPIYLAPLAPSITAGGRGMLKYARQFINKPFNQLLNLCLTNQKKEYKKFSKEYFEKFPEHRFEGNNRYNNKKEFIKYFRKRVSEIVEHIDNKENLKVNPDVVYGDTDSVFFVMNYNMEISDLLMTSINFGQLSGETICKTLPEPEKMVYEKTMFRFIQLAKKKYVGNLYEDDDKNYFQKNMGIVLKRRDNAKIVKIVVGGIVDHMLNKNENSEIIKYVRTVLKNILRGKYPIEYFIISKTLKKNYKNRSSIAHAVLADRIAKRDPGNKPQVNDRIQYVYFISNKKTKLQGDKIEDPKYLLDNNLELDYLYYITNQIEKPALQFLELIVENPKTIFKNAIDSETKRRKGQTSIDKLMSKYENNEIDNNEEDIENSLSSDTLSFNDEDIKTVKNKKFTITF